MGGVLLFNLWNIPWRQGSTCDETGADTVQFQIKYFVCMYSHAYITFIKSCTQLYFACTDVVLLSTPTDSPDLLTQIIEGSGANHTLAWAFQSFELGGRYFKWHQNSMHFHVIGYIDRVLRGRYLWSARRFRTNNEVKTRAKREFRHKHSPWARGCFINNAQKTLSLFRS